MSEQLEGCPTDADADRAECLEGVSAQIANANAELDAAFAACNETCASASAQEPPR
jgi:hypothetical protein